jgi:hypothetical protein
MRSVAETIKDRLKPLVGLRLAIARRAGPMRNFQFGQIRAIERGTVGDYALHIQCPWRLEGPDGILTGSSDLWEPAEASAIVDWKTWNCDRNENLQDHQLSALLGGYDPSTRSFVNETQHLVVEDVQTDDWGGVRIQLSGGFRLILFPAGSHAEDWRVFPTRPDQRHLVISGGKVQQSE